LAIRGTLLVAYFFVVSNVDIGITVEGIVDLELDGRGATGITLLDVPDDVDALWGSFSNGMEEDDAVALAVAGLGFSH
jgi:hypothetical protein